MCIMCEMKKAAASVAGLEVIEERLAFISKESIKELDQLDEAEDKLLEEIDQEQDRLIEIAKVKIEAKIAEQFGKKKADLEAYQKKVFESALEEEGVKDVDLKGEITINKKTGEVTMKRLVPKKDAKGVH